jgi:hypothetical protein
VTARGKRPAAAAFVLGGIVLAQLVGCGSCVKDEDVQQQQPGSGRKPIDLRAADKRFSRFTVQDAAADASSDGSTD